MTKPLLVFEVFSAPRLLLLLLVLCCPVDIIVVTAGVKVVASAPINPRLFAFSSYLGPVVNLAFDDPAVLAVAKTLQPGSLRYPGGGTANNWNISTGRWTGPQTSLYANRTNMRPIGTFTPDNYMRGIGGSLRASPIWNLNLVTHPDPPHQLNVLRDMGVPVDYIELGNEKADEPLAPYLQRASPVTARTRELFPNATVSAIFCFGLPKSSCGPALGKAYRTQPRPFDAVTVHHYGPTNGTITSRGRTDAERRAVTLGSARASLWAAIQPVHTYIGVEVPIWLDEFNWGGPWANVTWPDEKHGALRGIFWAAHVLSAIEINSKLHTRSNSNNNSNYSNGNNGTKGAAATAGIDALMYYSLFYQEASPWSYWASCAKVPDNPSLSSTEKGVSSDGPLSKQKHRQHQNQLLQPNGVAYGGMAQIFAHVTRIALAQGYNSVTSLPDIAPGSTIPARLVPGDYSCVVAARFANSDDSDLLHQTGRFTVIAVNACTQAAPIVKPVDSPQLLGNLTAWYIYEGTEVGGWVPAEDISSLDKPPWINGPLPVRKGNVSVTQITLPPLSLSILEYVSKMDVA